MIKADQLKPTPYKSTIINNEAKETITTIVDKNAKRLFNVNRDIKYLTSDITAHKHTIVRLKKQIEQYTEIKDKITKEMQDKDLKKTSDENLKSQIEQLTKNRAILEIKPYGPDKTERIQIVLAPFEKLVRPGDDQQVQLIKYPSITATLDFEKDRIETKFTNPQLHNYITNSISHFFPFRESSYTCYGDLSGAFKEHFLKKDINMIITLLISLMKSDNDQSGFSRWEVILQVFNRFYIGAKLQKKLKRKDFYQSLIKDKDTNFVMKVATYTVDSYIEQTECGNYNITTPKYFFDGYSQESEFVERGRIHSHLAVNEKGNAIPLIKIPDVLDLEQIYKSITT